jgi:uncharacterized protein YecE (DUF72 family)
MNVWIGTSGYSYRDWVGDFYPRGTPSSKMLAYYSRQFPLVELNFTFYRLPTAAMLIRLAGQTPPGFQFLVKLPQSLSHERSPLDLPGFRQTILALRKRDRLMGLLCQLTSRKNGLPGWREASRPWRWSSDCNVRAVNR